MDSRDLIDKLFNWKKELNIINNKGETVLTVYQRLVGDSDLQFARTKALGYSRRMRTKLRDESSDEYIAFVEGYSDFTKEELINTILFDQIIEIRTQVEKDFYFPETVEPDEDASTEETEKYEEEKATWEDRRNKKLNSLVEKELKKRREELERETQESLLVISKESRINALCEVELRRRFVEVCTFLGTFSDKKYKKLLFSSFEEFLESPEILKTQLLEGYTSLEISSVNLKG